MLFRHVVMIDDLGDSATINVCVVKIQNKNSIPTTMWINGPRSKIFLHFFHFFLSRRTRELSVRWCCVCRSFKFYLLIFCHMAHETVDKIGLIQQYVKLLLDVRRDL
jgi:hypothetical protein